ncbi:type II toxin-antitoxin system VapC family toxin [Methylococcus sp. Mc7]|uniref:type II toxin-antitoxin system VapC family toxin n=1 Tax=Methylococcus sp. Mc7 TaxID=2860258 RepID=UPI001C532553|nr:type II toxin-antitoxin system VapC family toxin [Methylococcus sp. Mc7]QXP85265.1 type II toxin-antitoxin system VapC family toxin [Methylococcus sp. Mc7]
MSYLVDTDIISELCRPRPDPGVLAWAARVERLSLSVITVEEICYGLARRPSERLRMWMEQYFRGQTVLPVTETVARRAGELRGEFAGRGISREQADMLIAATAQIHALTLVTRNTRDFEGCGIALLNPFGVFPP